MTNACRGTGVCFKTASLGGSFSAIRLKKALLGQGAQLKPFTIAAAERSSEADRGRNGLGRQREAVDRNPRKPGFFCRRVPAGGAGGPASMCREAALWSLSREAALS